MLATSCGSSGFPLTGLIITGLGFACVVLGIVMSLREQNRTPGALSALDGLAKLAEALRDYSTGRFLVVWGTVLMLIGGVVGGVSGLAAAL